MRTSESQYPAEALKNVPTWTCVNHRPTITGSVITAKQSFSHHISFTPPWRLYCTPTLLRPALFILHLFLSASPPSTISRSKWCDGKSIFPATFSSHREISRTMYKFHIILWFASYLSDWFNLCLDVWRSFFFSFYKVIKTLNMTSHSSPTSQAVSLKSLSSFLSTFN